MTTTVVGDDAIDPDKEAAAAAVAKLWNNVRLAVVDVETVTHQGEFWAVAVGIVTCRMGTVRGKWQTLIDPGVPIDATSAAIHHLTNDHLVGEPDFAAVADIIRRALTPAPGELLVFVAHNANFDSGVLRHEYERIGQQMPDLRVLDTQKRLPGHAGVNRDGLSLRALCDALDIRHDRPHDALADAVVTAEAVVALLARAASNGEDDFTKLLDAVSGPDTTLTVTEVTPSMMRHHDPLPTVPADHAATHSTTLSKRAGSKMLAAWRRDAAECAELRCHVLADRVATADKPDDVLLAELDAVLDDCIHFGDVPGAATVLGAMLPLLERVPPFDRTTRKNPALVWSAVLAPRLAGVGRCGADRCPHCARLEPCPLDVWPDALAVPALGPFTVRHARDFLRTTEVHRSVWATWTNNGHEQVADAALVHLIWFWEDLGQRVRSTQVAQLAWHHGCRHPDVTAVYVRQVAAALDTKSLRRAMAITRLTMRRRDGSTHEGWHRLEARYRQAAAALERSQVRWSGYFDADGNPVPVRRHHPETPRRTRPRRFQR